MDNQEGYTVYCSRCGAEMNSNSRYCMKCGNLNYDHEENKKMRPFLKNVTNTYQVGSGKFMMDSRDSNQLHLSVANNTGNKLLCFCLNYGILLFIVLGSFIHYYRNGADDLYAIMATPFPIIITIASLSFLLLYSIQLIFMKCNRRWWMGLIPFYNFFVLADITFHKKWLGFLTLIPVFGQIFCLFLLFHLGKQFKMNGFMTALFPVIMLPVIGFGDNTYEGYTFVNGDRTLEIDYKFKKVFLLTALLCLSIGILLLVLAHKDNVQQTSSFLGNSYYIYASDAIVKKVQKSVDANQVFCRDSAFVNGSGVYYFYYSDLSEKVFLPLNFIRESISAYVKLDYSSGQAVYSVSMSDGEKGFSEILYEDLEESNVENYTRLTLDYRDVNTCDFN